MIPALTVDGLCRCLRILEVAQHHIQTSREDLSGDATRIRRVDLYLHVPGGLSTGTGCEVVPVLIANNRRTLRGTITDGIGEVDFLEEVFYLLIEGCTTDDNLVHVAAKGLQHFLTDHLANLLRDDRHLQKQTHAVVLDLREDFLADNLLNDQRYGDDNDGLDFLKCLGDDGG